MTRPQVSRRQHRDGTSTGLHAYTPSHTEHRPEYAALLSATGVIIYSPHLFTSVGGSPCSGGILRGLIGACILIAIARAFSVGLQQRT
jgi:hypothetical protein